MRIVRPEIVTGARMPEDVSFASPFEPITHSDVPTSAVVCIHFPVAEQLLDAVTPPLVFPPQAAMTASAYEHVMKVEDEQPKKVEES